jgi:hypothetical protein
MNCPMKYIGQTGRPFNTRYKERIRDIKNNNSKSGYSNHILNTGHSYGNITDTMEIIKIERKGKTSKHIRKISHTVDSRLSALGLTALRLNRGNVFLKKKFYFP